MALSMASEKFLSFTVSMESLFMGRGDEPTGSSQKKIHSKRPIPALRSKLSNQEANQIRPDRLHFKVTKPFLQADQETSLFSADQPHLVH